MSGIDPAQRHPRCAEALPKAQLANEESGQRAFFSISVFCFFC